MLNIYKKFKKLGEKEENKELIRHSLLAVIVRIGAAGAAFAMNVIVARYLGARQAGYFFLAVSITTVVASIGRVGADQTVLRFVSIHAGRKEWSGVHAVMKKMMSWTYIPLIAFSVLLCVFSKQISVYCFHKEELRWPLFWTSIAVPLFAAYNVQGMALQAIKKVVYSVTVLKILTPAFLIIVTLIFPPTSSSQISIYYLIACIANLLIGYLWWFRSIPKAEHTVEYDTKKLWASSGPLWVSSIMQQLTVWGGQLIAGVYVRSEEVAQLAVARNMTVLVSFILLAVNNVSSPRIATMYHEGQLNKLKNYVRNTTWMMIIVALPISLIIWFFPGYILSLFGKEFTSGSGLWVLRILTVGQFISVVSGTVGTLLVMCGYEKDLKNMRILNGCITVALALILTPIYGAIGSALSSAIAMSLFNLMCVGIVKKKLGFTTFGMFGLEKSKKTKRIESIIE